jgi:hypothetical protein
MSELEKSNSSLPIFLMGGKKQNIRLTAECVALRLTIYIDKKTEEEE